MTKLVKSDLIYLDYNSTTPVDPRVVEQVLPYLNNDFGNAASRSHPFGWTAKVAVDDARQAVADLIGANPKEIVWTSGATEAINLAIKGVYQKYASKGNHIITTKTEHKAVLDVCEHLEKQGASITYLDVDQYGRIDISTLTEAITPQTILVSIMWANNETGTIQPIRSIGEVCKKHDVLFMTDATQIVGKLHVNVQDMGIDLLACSAHKMYGMKGVGALYVRNKSPKVSLTPQNLGGGHEGGLRSGTLNVPGIVSMGAAASLSQSEMLADAERITLLRDKMEKAILDIEETYLNSYPSDRMYNVTNISFKYIDSEALIATMNQTVAVSTGSACTSASLEPSHVLLAMGLSDHMAHAAIRFSLGSFTTDEEIDRCIALIQKGVDSIRSQSPIWQMYKDGVDVDELLG